MDKCGNCEGLKDLRHDIAQLAITRAEDAKETRLEIARLATARAEDSKSTAVLAEQVRNLIESVKGWTQLQAQMAVQERRIFEAEEALGDGNTGLVATVNRFTIRLGAVEKTQDRFNKIFTGLVIGLLVETGGAIIAGVVLYLLRIRS